MIKHIVFFGLADNAEGKTKAENALIPIHQKQTMI